jgi:hypothetical protein
VRRDVWHKLLINKVVLTKNLHYLLLEGWPGGRICLASDPFGWSLSLFCEDEPPELEPEGRAQSGRFRVGLVQIFALLVRSAVGTGMVCGPRLELGVGESTSGNTGSVFLKSLRGFKLGSAIRLIPRVVSGSLWGGVFGVFVRSLCEAAIKSIVWLPSSSSFS